MESNFLVFGLIELLGAFIKWLLVNLQCKITGQNSVSFGDLSNAKKKKKLEKAGLNSLFTGLNDLAVGIVFLVFIIVVINIIYLIP